MKHWLQLVAIPNAPESAHKQELTYGRTGESPRTFTFSKQTAAAATRRHGSFVSRSSGAGVIFIPARFESRQEQKKGKGKGERVERAKAPAATDP